MTIVLNGNPVVTSALTVHDLLEEQGYAGMIVATAVNSVFCPVSLRHLKTLAEGDHVDIVAPMQGG